MQIVPPSDERRLLPYRAGLHVCTEGAVNQMVRARTDWLAKTLPSVAAGQRFEGFVYLFNYAWLTEKQAFYWAEAAAECDLSAC